MTNETNLQFQERERESQLVHMGQLKERASYVGESASGVGEWASGVREQALGARERAFGTGE